MPKIAAASRIPAARRYAEVMGMEYWQRLEHPANVLVCGASLGIGLALSEQLLARADVARVWAVARHASQSADLAALAERHGDRLQRLDLDCCDEAALAALAQQLRADPAAQAPVAAAAWPSSVHSGGAVGTGRLDWRQPPRRLVQLPGQQGGAEPAAAHRQHRAEPAQSEQLRAQPAPRHYRYRAVETLPGQCASRATIHPAFRGRALTGPGGASWPGTDRQLLGLGRPADCLVTYPAKLRPPRAAPWPATRRHRRTERRRCGS